MDHGIYIEYENQVLQLPVNPEKITIKHDSNNSTANIVGLGEINRIGIANLREVGFESFFTNSPSSFVRTRRNFQPPRVYLNLIERIRRDRRPCRLVVTNTRINMLVSVEMFDNMHEHAEGDVYYSVVFKEFRNHSAREVTINITPAKPPRATTSQPRQPSTNQRVVQGSRVIVNGRLHRDSFGSGPGQTEVNATRIVNFLAPGRSHPYHVTLESGGWRGWVAADSITRIL